MKLEKSQSETYQIKVRGLRLFAYHGVRPEENKLGQEFEIDLSLTVTHASTLKSDKLDEVVNYWEVLATVRDVFTGKTFKLLENAAQTVLEALHRYHQIKQATIHLKKLTPPIPVTVDNVGVVMEKTYST